MILIDGEELLNDINESIEIESESESADTMKSKIVISALRIARNYVKRFIKHKSPWISVKDELPKADGKYMVWRDGEWEICEFDAEYQRFGYTYEDYDEMYSRLVGWDDTIHDDVTHWMPLPEKPKEDKDERKRNR